MTLAIAIAFAAAAVTVVGIALRVIFQSVPPSSVTDYRPCKGGWWEGELNHCKSGLLMVPQQPVNTYTNLAYIAGGLFLAFKLNTLPFYVLSLTSLYLCAGSTLYHATSTRWAGSLDVSSMYAMFSALTAYAAFTLIGLKEPLVALIMFVVAILCGYLLRYKYRGNVSLKIGIFLVLTYVFAIWNMRKSNKSWVDDYLITSFVLFAIAYVGWYMDKKRIFPLKRWGHGLWHLLTATAISILCYSIYLTQ
jgi:predicted membrane channel-forming protein YqfA (hemolysin III family)